MSTTELAFIRVRALHGRLASMIHRHLVCDGVHKAYEGEVDLAYVLPNVFAAAAGAKAGWRLTVRCYVLGPSRGEVFDGASPGAVLDAFDVWLDAREVELVEEERECGRAAKELPA